MSGDQAGNKLRLELAAKFIKESKAPSLEELPGKIDKNDDSKKAQLAYALALSAVQYFVDRFGMPAVQIVIDSMAEGKSFASAIRNYTGFSFVEFQQNWKECYSQ